jgi:pimeloyl-ACP methyl ester carboxylesterase
MRAFYFGPSERQLFGAFHPADAGQSGEQRAVLLAYPWLAEYNMAHWAFRKLAGMLAQAGCSVLRFDYSGTGDSSGETADVRCEAQWPTDIGVATQELIDQSGAREVSVVGFGMGATLALKASAEHPYRDLVLWDPVISGSEYLQELEALDFRQRTQRLYRPGPSPAEGGELLGHPFPAAARADLLRVDIQRYQPRITGRSLVLASEQRASYATLRARLAALGSEAALQVLPRASVPIEPGAGHTAMMATEALSAIVAFMRAEGA